MNNSDFYDVLRKTQPYAFLASFSLIIGIISSAKDYSLPDIQSDAIIAGLMFIFAFITAITNQVFKKSDLIEKFTRLSQHFFFVIGLIYFLFIALKFSETLLQIPTIFVGWLVIFLGIGFFVRIYPIKKNFWRTKKKLIEIEDKIAYPLIGLGFFIMGGSLVVSALFQQTLDWSTVFLLSISFGVIGFSLYMGCEILRLESLRRRLKRQK